MYSLKVLAMPHPTIIGRKTELALLDQITATPEAALLAVYGRRRIGKTFLVHEYFKEQGYFFELTGTRNASLKTQLEHFREAFAETFHAGLLQPVPKSWQEAFYQLRKIIESLDTEKKIILFFDELPWLAGPRSQFLASLEHVWNRYFSRQKNIIVIVCGSAAAWMLKKIIYNKGGLYGRLTAEIHLKPFTLGETESYLQSQGVFLDKKQIIELYLAFGGVAKYLSNIPKGQSSAQIIAQTCFNPTGFFPLEFPKLYESLFEKPKVYMDIVTALAEKKSGLNQTALLKKIKMQSGGKFTQVLKELEVSGFIASITEFGHKKKHTVYRLIDEYSLFYLTWIKPALSAGLPTLSPSYWHSLQNSPAYTTWAGYAFEGICLKHVNKIIKALNIEIIARGISAWSFQSKTQRGAQIDLVIDRADNCINLCEIKYYNVPFTVTQDYADTLRYKKACFQEQTGTRKSLFTTMISSYGITSNPHALASIDAAVTMDILFD